MKFYPRNNQYPTITLLNVATLSPHHCQQTPPESSTCLCHLRGIDSGHRLGNCSSQRLHAAVWSSTRLSLHLSPQEKVARIQIRTAGGPFVGGPKMGEILPAELLHNLGRVSGRIILLPREQSARVLCLQPRQHRSLQNAQVTRSSDGLARLKKVRRHDFPVAADDSKDHDMRRFL